MEKIVVLLLLIGVFGGNSKTIAQNEKPRVIVTTDGEIDDQASMVRFLLNTNEFDVEGIINSNSQFHWVGGKGWNQFQPVSWVTDYIDLYAKVYPNLLLQDKNYPSPDLLLSKWKVGNISEVGEDDIRTEGAELIVEVLLKEEDPRPIWIQAWGGCNTISRALKTIQEDHPERMASVAQKIRLFLIWEQDKTYMDYIRPNWEPYNITTIISDQFDCIAYKWPKVLPDHIKTYFEADWMTKNIIESHGPLCDIYPNNNGAYNAEGDSPAFFHNIPNGLRSMESPSYGGWGGRYTKVRNNVWMDPLPDSTYSYPEGQRGQHNSWAKQVENDSIGEKLLIRTKYFKPLWRCLENVQNEFAARADWCIKDYATANHPPIVRLKKTPLNIKRKADSKVKLNACASIDPDGDVLTYHWWQ